LHNLLWRLIHFVSGSLHRKGSSVMFLMICFV